MSTKSEYIVACFMLSSNLSDSKAVIPLLKKVAEVVVSTPFTTVVFDEEYDY
ncbi:hypothetical protein AAGS61_20745 [Lysinibacillus sp. KU-BSD001]|uniref:hypothetical protein n=1 Tax=Lysinibacillus sp. KU-BSD001 TaxID=3141328 RepID=UPI0036E9A498